MQPYGLGYPQHNQEDNHPRKGFVNWWEKDIRSVVKKRDRRNAKKDIEKMIIEYEKK